MKIILTAVFAALSVAAIPATAIGSLDPAKLRLASANALIIGAGDDAPIYAKNAESVTPIASITKSLERIADESESRWREPRAPAEAPPSDVAATTSVSMSPADAAPPASHPPEGEAGGTNHARQPRAAPHS